MDDFSVFGYSYKGSLENLRKVLERCHEKNLVLNWEKCHFMVDSCHSRVMRNQQNLFPMSLLLP